MGYEYFVKATRAEVRAYGERLVEAGFKVWFHEFGSGYLTYEKNGLHGSFQGQEFDDHQHLMPILPSRAHGSYMHIGIPVKDVWSVEAAEQCASRSNRNDVVGKQSNIGVYPKDSLPGHVFSTRANAIALHDVTGESYDGSQPTSADAAENGDAR